MPSTKIVILILAILVAGGVLLFVKKGDALWKGVVFDRGASDTSDSSGIVAVSGDGSQQSQGNWQDTLNKVVPSGGNNSESMTDKLASGIIAKAPELQSQGSDQSTQDMVNSVVKGLPEGNPAIVHALKELSVVGDSTASALKTYGDALANIFVTYSKKLAGIGYEITIVEKAINTNDDSELTKLPAIESLYKNMIRDLMAIKVPKDTEKMHLNLVNAYELAISSIGDMESVISDPAKGLVGISRYKAGSQIIQESIGKLNSLFKTRGVIFEQGNTGFIFSSTASQ